MRSNHGTFAELDRRLSFALVAAGIVLAIATILIVLFAK